MTGKTHKAVGVCVGVDFTYWGIKTYNDPMFAGQHNTIRRRRNAAGLLIIITVNWVCVVTRKSIFKKGKKG